MFWGISPLSYILVVLADLTYTALCYSSSRRFRWLAPLALAISSIPLLLFLCGILSTLHAMRRNAEEGLALFPITIGAAPFLACFIASAVLLYLRRTRLPPLQP